MSAVEAQRRVQLKATQIEAASGREQEQLRRITGMRTNSENALASKLKSFEAVKTALLRARDSKLPALQLQRLSGTLETLRKKKGELERAQTKIESLKKNQVQIYSRLQVRQRQRDALKEKDRAANYRVRAGRQAREADCCSDATLVRMSLESQLASAREVMKSEVPSQLSRMRNLELGEQRVLTQLAERMQELVVSDTATRSQVGMQFCTTEGGSIGVELVRKGEHALEVRLTPDRHSDGRRLWRTRECILKALTDAGYSVGRFVVTTG